MEGIQVDFAMQRGHEMIVRRDPPFVRADLDEVDLQMLQAVRPPGLLAVDWFEMDGGVTFRYAVDGRKLLPHRLIGGPFGMNEYLGLMLGIVEALENCGHHLLRESCCLLEEKFLFIGADWRDAALTYLPLRDPPVKKPVREELLGLAIRLIGKAERVDGEAVQTVLRLLDDPAATWSKIRLGLLQLMAPDRRAGAGHPGAEPAGSGRIESEAGIPDAFGQPADGRRPADPDSQGSVRVWPPVQGPDRAGGRAGEFMAPPDAEESGPQTGGKRNRFELLGKLFRGSEPAVDPPPETLMFDEREWPSETTGRIRDTGRARWLSACGAVLATAFIWRYIYLPSPGMDRLLICLGATLLAAGGLFLLWQRLTVGNREPLHDARSEAGAEAGYADGGEAGIRRPEAADGRHGESGIGNADTAAGFRSGAPWGDMRADEAEIRFSWRAEFPRDNRPAPDAAFAWHTESGSQLDGDVGTGAGSSPSSGAHPDHMMTGAAVAANEEETGLPEDETVLLGRDGGMFWLVREYEGTHRRIPVEPGAQIIGRSETHARIVDTAEGVSRAHLEIACDGAEVRIKDLASRNGTLLGGEIMVPYKEYALHAGDVFRLAGPDGPKYTLRKGG